MGESPSIKENCVKRKLPYQFSFFWFVLTSCLVVLMGEDIAFFEGYGIHFDVWAFYLIALSAFASCLGYLIFAHHCFDVKIQGGFLALFLVLAIGNGIGLLSFPKVLDAGEYDYLGNVYYAVRYELLDAERIRYFVSFCITCFYFYILWGIAPKCLKNEKACDAFLIGGILISLVAIIYSWCTEWTTYSAYFEKDAFAPFSGFPSSFLGNSNTFASLLLYGIVSTWVLQARRHCWVNYLLAILFNVEIFLIFSKTCLILLAIFWPMYILYRYLATVKAHPVRSSILLGGLVASVLGLIFSWRALAHASPDSIFGKYWFHILDMFKKDEALTLFIRIGDWNRVLSVMESPLVYAFGFGAINMDWLLAALLHTPEGTIGYIHNGAMFQFASGGLLRVLVYLVLLVYAFCAFIKALGKKQKGALPLFLGFLLMLGHGFTEATSFLDGNTKGVVGVLTLIYPVLIPMAKSNDATLARPSFALPKSWTLSSFFFLSPFLAFGPTLPAFAKAFGFSLLFSLLLCLLLFALFLSIPLIVNIAKKESFGEEYVIPLCFSLVVGFSFFSLSMFLPLKQKWSELVLLCLSSCSTCLLLLGLPPFAKRAFPGLFRLIDKCEGLSLRIGDFFAFRNSRREERYYARKRKPKAREALHY